METPHDTGYVPFSLGSEHTDLRVDVLEGEHVSLTLEVSGLKIVLVFDPTEANQFLTIFGQAVHLLDDPPETTHC